jgi:hypothetical protein
MNTETSSGEPGERRHSSEQSSLSILGQKSVDSLLTEDSNASHMSGASVKPGSLTEPGGIPLDAFRDQAGNWEQNYTGQFFGVFPLSIPVAYLNLDQQFQAVPYLLLVVEANFRSGFCYPSR